MSTYDHIQQENIRKYGTFGTNLCQNLPEKMGNVNPTQPIISTENISAQKAKLDYKRWYDSQLLSSKF